MKGQTIYLADTRFRLATLFNSTVCFYSHSQDFSDFGLMVNYLFVTQSTYSK